MNCPKLFPIAEEQLYIGARPKETLAGDFPPLFRQEQNCAYLFLYIEEATILIGLDLVLLFSFLKLADAIADSAYALIPDCSHGFLQYCDCAFSLRRVQVVRTNGCCSVCWRWFPRDCLEHCPRTSFVQTGCILV